MDQSTTIDPIPLRDLWPWALVAAVLVVVLYLVTLDQGAVSRAGLFLHELMHDGRHVLALPCH
jgi:Probable cobalt transporter subunit (CbtB)